MDKSIIYRNIHVYRMAMNLLYAFGYRQRFRDVMALISGRDKKILELCFGDIYIAEECKTKNIEWTGMDINERFVGYASGKGYNAICADLLKTDEFPTSDACIMMGSFYHFYPEVETMLVKMLRSAPKIIISEPVRNLSSAKGFIGMVSRKLSNAGKGPESFRFDEKSIVDTFNELCYKYKFTYKVISKKRDILIEIANERNQHCDTCV
ncbi:MAG: class I SAM-dependent methyltransferase [Bacteroidia bacterium]|nr:class I SAM-dependent methyltransferase [Bacteroidia bacterium]